MRPRRVLGCLMACVYFGTQVLFAQAPESRFWSERRKFARQTGQAPAALAAAPGAFLQQLPAPGRVTQTLSRSVIESLPRGFAREHAALLSSLPAQFGSIRK